MDIKEFRQQYPEYNDIPDMELAKKLHAKSYSDMPFDTFSAKFGVSAAPAKSTYLGDVLRERGQALFASGGVGQAPTSSPEGAKVPFLQQFARGSVEALPTAGAMFGGAIGAAPGLLTGPAAIPVMSVGGVAGAGLGAGGGESLKQTIQQMYPDYFGVKPQSIPGQYADVAKSGLAGATGEAGGQILTAGVSKILPLTAKKMTAEGKALYETAKKQNLPLSPSALNPSKRAKFFEWTGDILPTGKAWGTHKRVQLQNGLTRMADDYVASLPSQGDKFEAGTKLAEGIKTARSVLKTNKDEAYKLWEKALGDTPIDMSSTIAVINKNTLPDELKSIASTEKLWKPSDVVHWQANIWGETYSKNRKLGQDLLDALEKDLGPTSFGVLASAKDKFKLMKDFNSNLTVKSILRKYGNDPEQVIQVAFRSGNLDDVTAIKNAVDKDTWDLATSRFVENLIDVSSDVQGNAKIFKPGKFADLFEKYGRQIQNVMPDIYDNLKNFAAISRASVNDINKIKMSPMGNLWHGAGLAGLGTGLAFGNAGVTIPYGASFVMAKSLMNPKGWMKQWLTVGAKPGTGTKLAKEGAKAISLKMFNGEKDEREQE